MKSNLFLRLITVLCFLFMGALNASAEQISNAEARKWVEEKGNLLLDTFSEKDVAVKYQKLDELFINHVDLDYIGKFVMGRNWRLLSAEQQQRYMSLFKRYSLGVYKGFPLTFENKITFVVAGATNKGDTTNVMATIDLGKQPGDAVNKINAEFRLHKNKNKIQIIDIKLGESSLILSYRGRFGEMFANSDNDVEWFLEDLETVTVSTERNAQMKLRDAKQ